MLSIEEIISILNAISDGLIAVDRNGYITILNTSAEKLLNLKRDGVLGKKVSDIIPNTRLHIILETGEPEVGLTKDDVIGKPATVDIAEGESVHYRVLKMQDSGRCSQQSEKIMTN